MLTQADNDNTPDQNSTTVTPDGGHAALTEPEARTLLKNVIDPDIGVNIVDLGLIYKIDIDGGNIQVDMTLTTPACPYGPQLIQETTYILKSQDGVDDVKIDIVWDPPWSMDLISEATKLEMGMDI